MRVSHYYFTDCTNDRVRLIGGTTSNEGTIEICINNLWGMISDAGWDENDAKVICRQLDLPYDGTVTTSSIVIVVMASFNYRCSTRI